jgi:hemolysin activation/secretion protein
MSLTRYWAVCVCATLSPAVVYAQQTVDPGRIDERLRPAPAIPDVRSIEVPELPRQEQVPQASLNVTLTSVRFEGATAVPVAALDAIAAPYLNREMPLAEIFKLAEGVTAEYRRRGFVLSRAVVGPQRIENGVLTVQVIEGRIGQTRIEGEAGGYRPYLERYLATAAAAQPVTGDRLSRALLLARDLQGIDVRAVITPSAAEVGAADLSLVVDRDPIEGFAMIDNRGSRWLGPVQVYGGVILNDALGLGERISVTGVTAPVHRELGFISGSYDQPIGGSGLRLNVFGSYAATHPGDELRALDLRGESTTWGAGLRYPLVRSRDANLIGQWTFTGRDSNSHNAVIDPIFDDKIRTLSGELLGNYAAPWGGLISVRISVTKGIDVLGATVRSDVNKSRATATGQATRFNFEASLIQPIFDGLHVQLSSAGQTTDDSLLAAEEFGLGGDQFGHAYDPSEVTGDKGIAGRAELFYAMPRHRWGTIQPYAYYEGGAVYQNHPLAGERTRRTLESAGAGIRASLDRGFSGSIEFAKPLGQAVAARGDKDGRVFFSLSAAF